MIDLSKKVFCQKDYGLFGEVALMIARETGARVLYNLPNKSAFPLSSLSLVCKNFGDVEVIPDREGGKDFEDYEEEIDAYIYMDIMDGAEQMKLRREGKRVWGSGYSDKLEINRKLYRELQKKLGIPAPPTKFVYGIKNLRKELQERGDKECWVKISLYRGDFETFHSFGWKTSEEIIEKWEYQLGPKKDDIWFLVEDPVEPDGVEPGYDGAFVNGEFLNPSAYGYEEKGAAYIGRICRLEQMPKPIQWLLEKHVDLLEEYGLQGNCSFELRIGKRGIPHSIDPCMRGGSPPTECIIEGFSNWPEVMFAGGDGDVVQLKPRAKYMALARVISSEAIDNWLTVDFPESIRRWIKFRNTTNANDKYQVRPSKMDTVASVVGLGDTPKEAAEEVKLHAKDIHGTGVSVLTDDLEKVLETIERGKKVGINF